MELAMTPPKKSLQRSTQSSGRPGLPPAGVVGMGLMGTSIAVCLLGAGHSVVGIARNSEKHRGILKRLMGLLNDSAARGLIHQNAQTLMGRFTISSDMAALRSAEIVIESTVEDLAVKQTIITSIEDVLGRTALIGSNTSAIPVTQLQQLARYPQRVLGLHWAEPAHITRFMEIICGAKTSVKSASRAMDLARLWGKEPSLLRKDIRGFITNRIMYAMLREAFFLVENGYASIADVDRSLRNDLGYWITFAGPFRFMDLTGIPAYASVMKDLLPELCRDTDVPALMSKVVGSGALGVSNARGFYRYTPQQAKRWDHLFLKFSHEIRELAQRYPEGIGDLPLRRPPAKSRKRPAS
jgi:3-hydroxybutyryl-CoA dehydrogenase